MTSGRSVALLLAFAATTGASYLFVDVGLRSYSSGGVAFGRVVLAAAFLLPLALRDGGFRSLRGAWAAVAVAAVIQVAGPYLLVAEGQRYVSSSVAGILIAAVPIYAAVLAFFTDPTERLGARGLAGVSIGLAGVALLVGVDTGGSSDALRGCALILVSGLGFAAGGLYVKRQLAGRSPTALACATMGAASLLTLPFAATSTQSPELGPTLALVALGTVSTGLVFFLFYRLIAEIGTVRAMVVSFLAPPFAVFYGVVLLGERAGLAALGGLVLIIFGSSLTMREPRRQS